MKSQVELSTMLFVLILSLMAAFCSAKDKKPPDTKVTNCIYNHGHCKLMWLQLNNVSTLGKK